MVSFWLDHWDLTDAVHNSEQLRDRYPYRDPPFRKTIDPEQVAQAFGSRSIPKYADLLIYPDLSTQDRIRALKDVLDLLSSQEHKTLAIDAGMVESSTELTLHPDAQVKEYAARVLAGLLIDRKARQIVQRTNTLENIDGLLRDAIEGVAQAAALASSKLSLFRDGVELMVEKQVIVGNLVRMLTKTNDLVTLDSAVEALMNITKNTAGAQAAVAAEFVRALVELFRMSRSIKPSTLLNGIICSWNLALHVSCTRCCIMRPANVDVPADVGRGQILSDRNGLDGGGGQSSECRCQWTVDHNKGRGR